MCRVNCYCSWNIYVIHVCILSKNWATYESFLVKHSSVETVSSTITLFPHFVLIRLKLTLQYLVCIFLKDGLILAVLSNLNSSYEPSPCDSTSIYSIPNRVILELDDNLGICHEKKHWQSWPSSKSLEWNFNSLYSSIVRLLKLTPEATKGTLRWNCSE